MLNNEKNYIRDIARKVYDQILIKNQWIDFEQIDVAAPIQLAMAKTNNDILLLLFIQPIDNVIPELFIIV